MLQNFVVSHIRTWVPMAVGALLTWLAANQHIVIDPKSEAALVTLMTAVLSGAYYSLARLVEQKFPTVGGLMLGSTAKPVYTDASGFADPQGVVDDVLAHVNGASEPV